MYRAMTIVTSAPVLHVRVADATVRARVAALLEDVLREPVECGLDPRSLRVVLRGPGRGDVRAAEAIAELGFAAFPIEAFSLEPAPARSVRAG
ncbi:hypothetical protein [Nocardioides sp. KR10-350]|uniref:hypothetical protein n=1 Tax=Nocardioides cheoyonin TaxID=3156615 RepID=UPI0032B4AA6B